ncbi:MAG: hypothetical protein J6N45_04720 [Alphaproteobacteria bacterium]|nr:hypothetical protein [Alphaproteobacteria bacterium]
MTRETEIIDGFVQGLITGECHEDLIDSLKRLYQKGFIDCESLVRLTEGLLDLADYNRIIEE